MAKLALEIVAEQVRESKGRSQKLIPLTDELYGKMSLANQILINLHEKFIGEVEECVEYTQGYGVPQEILDAVKAKFKV